MAVLRVFLPLTICLLLGHQTFAKNDAPCQKSKWNNGFNIFVKRHIGTGMPTSLDQNEWEKYIKKNGGCDRPTQSFLQPTELDRVKAVCTKEGRKTYKENLCISDQPFTFVTVRSEPGTCTIKSISPETKHLILGCEELENQCLPVHFEGNPGNLTTKNNTKSCQDPQSRDTQLKNVMATLVPLIICGFLLIIIGIMIQQRSERNIGAKLLQLLKLN